MQSGEDDKVMEADFCKDQGSNAAVSGGRLAVLPTGESVMTPVPRQNWSPP